MPTIEENRALWDRDWSGREAGDRWSKAWGGADMEWYGTILPRIHGFLPAGTALEIGPGFGRWTHWLRERCERLIAVDLSRSCIDACSERFRDDPRVECHANDGYRFAMVADGAIDFAFSFDSLVHAEEDVMRSYLGELGRVLAKDGVAFLHHSNAGRYRRYFEAVERAPRLVRRWGERLRLVDKARLRAKSVTAEGVRAHAEAARQLCASQELVNWGGCRLIDCFTVVCRPDSPHARGERTLLRNRGFAAESRRLRRLARLYAEGSGDGSA
jgi:SAM-dependent methyltransferase